MENIRIRHIINNYIDNQYNADIQYKFRKWLIDPESAKEKERFLLEYWESIQLQPDESIFEELEAIHKLIEKQESRKKRIRLKPLLGIASIIVLVLLSSITTFYFTHQSIQDVEMVECFAENGKHKKVTLPDNSEVWVNSGTVLIYPDKFDRDNRTVFLNGEAIFSVHPNKKKPFIVKTSNLDIEALGTTFNVKAYSDLSRTIATLEEGSVRVSSKSGDNKSYILSPNEQVIYDSKTGQMTKHHADAERVLSWKDGYMVFEGASMGEILHALSKRYNVMIQYNDLLHTGRTYTIRFSPDDNLMQCMTILKEIASPFRYDIQGTTIHVY